MGERAQSGEGRKPEDVAQQRPEDVARRPAGAAPGQDVAQQPASTAAEHGNGLHGSCARETAPPTQPAWPVMLHQVAMTGLSSMMAQPRQQLLGEILDRTALVSQVNAMGSLVGGLEAVCSPGLGALSDSVGRRPFMLAAPAVGFFMRLLAAARPAAWTLHLERVTCDAARAFAGTTMCYASLADIYGRTPELMAAVARCNSAMGLGMVLAPLVSSLAARCGRGARAAVALAALLSAVQLAVEMRTLRETRLEGEPPRRGSANPFSFLRLFTSGRRMRRLSTILALQCAVDGKILQDQLSVVQMLHFWDLDRRSLWTSAFGGAIIVGGQLTDRLVFFFGGQDAFLSAAHAASAFAFLAYSKGYFWLGVLFLIVGQQRRTPTIAWMLSECEGVGLGRGEIVAMTANLRAAVETVGPLAYGVAAAAAARRGKPALVFLVPAALAVAAEAAHAMTPPSAATPRGTPAARGEPGPKS